MQRIEVKNEYLTKGTGIQESGQNGYVFQFAKEGSGFRIPQIISCREHLLTFRAEVLEEHSLAMNLLVYVHGEKEPAFTVRFGLLPKVETTVCIDLDWMDARELFPEAMAGALKIVCHGRRVDKEEISEVVLSSMPSFHDVSFKIQDMVLTDQRPENVVLPDKKLVDCFGQSKWKDWEGKTKDTEELKKVLLSQMEDADCGYPFEDWSVYGGWKKKKLKEGLGYFSKCRENGKWWLVDPLGYAYFSMGPDCVGPGGGCRIKGVEQWLDWVPEGSATFFQTNLQRVFGETWYEDWKKNDVRTAKKIWDEHTGKLE